MLSVHCAWAGGQLLCTSARSRICCVALLPQRSERVMHLRTRAPEIDHAPSSCLESPRMAAPWGLGVPPLPLGVEDRDRMTVHARAAALRTLN